MLLLVLNRSKINIWEQNNIFIQLNKVIYQLKQVPHTQHTQDFILTPKSTCKSATMDLELKKVRLLKFLQNISE